MRIMATRDKMILGVTGIAGTALAVWKTMFPWIGDDIKTYKAIQKMTESVKQDFINDRYIIDMFEECVAKHPKKPFILFEDKVYTYEFVDMMANRVANVAAAWDLQLGNTVAIMMQNEPAFVWTLLGLQKLGLAVAFINYHLTASPLLHSIKSSEASILIIGEGEKLLESFEEIRLDIGELIVYVNGKHGTELPGGYHSMDDSMLNDLPLPISRAVREEVNFFYPMCFIYTSGTTGLPKPAIINHGKAIGMSKFYMQINFNKDDVIYVVTPLYHSAATCNGLFNTINVGATMALGRKFSLRHYWEDIRKYNVTVLQYIGELCRYLMKPPMNNKDREHKVRVAVGNGLRQDVWREFQDRFKIPFIAEFFGATEATSSFMNIVGKVGAVGRWSPLLRKFNTYGVDSQIVKYDPIKDEPVRDSKGFCVAIKPGEEGLLLSAIPASHTGFYRGSEEMNEKKIVRNVKAEDDQYFNYGDLVFLDNNYFLYFRDRTGDTFRWKGENVSTREVADVISHLEFVHDVNVYGVSVPGAEGRAGMAAIVLKEKQEVTPEILQKIHQRCHHDLPSYARPLFIRFMKELIVTQTMKQRKVELVTEGFDPSKITDPIYYMDASKKAYIPVNRNTYQKLLSSKF